MKDQRLIPGAIRTPKTGLGRLLCLLGLHWHQYWSNMDNKSNVSGAHQAYPPTSQIRECKRCLKKDQQIVNPGNADKDWVVIS